MTIYEVLETSEGGYDIFSKGLFVSKKKASDHRDQLEKEGRKIDRELHFKKPTFTYTVEPREVIE